MRIIPPTVFAAILFGACASLACADTGTFLRVDTSKLPPYSHTPKLDVVVTGLNDKGWVAGSYYFPDEGGVNKRGFVGPIGGPYTAFQFVSNGKTFGTEARALNNLGWIVGTYSPGADKKAGGAGCAKPDTNPPDKSSCQGFVRDANGGFFPIMKLHTQQVPLTGSTGQGVNSAGVLVGDYQPTATSAAILGFTGYKANGPSNAARLQDLTPFTTTSMRPRGISAQGDIVGWYKSANQVHGFKTTKADGKTVCFDIPVSLLHSQNPQSPLFGTYPQSINDNGVISGNWQEPDPNHLTDPAAALSHGFFLKDNMWTSFDAPNSTGSTQGFQINRDGQIAVAAGDGNFIYCPPGSTTNGCTGKVRPLVGLPKIETAGNVEQPRPFVPRSCP